MSNAIQTRVAVVVEPQFGESLETLIKHTPVWIVASDVNKPVYERIWKSSPHNDHREMGAITSFPVSNVNARKHNLLNVIADVETHHGVAKRDYLEFPKGFSLEVIGLTLDNEVTTALREHGFRSFVESPEGFTAHTAPQRD